MKTKITITTFLICCFTLSSYAQADKEEKIKKWQVGININTVEPISDAGYDNNTLGMRAFVYGDRQEKSFCLGINGAYKIQEKFTVRLSAKMTNYHIIETFDNRSFSNITDYELDTMDVRQSVYSFSPGIFWDGRVKKLNLYGGFQFRYQKFSPQTANFDVTFFTNNILTYHRNYYTRQDGGYSIGGGPFFGLSVNIFKNISVGSEFSTSYSYFKTGGKITQEVVDVLNNQYAGSIVSLQTYKGIRFSTILTSINLSINF